MTINVKLGTFEHNSYGSVDQADEYFWTRKNTDKWDLLSEPEKGAVLIQAARDFEWFNYVKSKYYETQGLSFPLSDNEIITGVCGTPLTTTSFRNARLYSVSYNQIPNNYWKYGTVHITSGTPLRETRAISESDVATGQITVASAFSATPLETTQFLIFAPLPKNVYIAQFEQALYLLDNEGVSSYSVFTNIGAKSVEIGDVAITFEKGSSSFKNPISPKSKALLGRWINRSLAVGRA